MSWHNRRSGDAPGKGGDMKMPLLSVTVNNYNYGRYLGQTIESIQRQTFGDFELILIDNASSDDSLEVMHRYASGDPRLRIVAHAENEGMFASLRESCELSRGRYRVPVEADDWVLAPDAFEVQVDMLERHPSIAFVYSSLTMMGSDARVHHMSRPYQADTVLAGEDAVEDILSFALTHTGMMMRMDALQATEGYGEDFPHVIDMLLGVRLCEVGDVGYIDRPLYAFRQHDSNLHLRPQLKVVEREVLPVIDAAFSGPLPSRLPNVPAVRRRVTRRALVHLPTQYIFVGELRTGWRLYWESCKAEPVATLAQPRTLSLVSRSVLGARGHAWVESRLRRLRGGARQRCTDGASAHCRTGAPRDEEKQMAHDELRRNDLVEVRGASEILATLDERGSLDGLPFMPEMIEHCGRRFRVERRAEKVCDTVNSNLQSRRLEATVFLDDLRCDGTAHNGCEAECRFYWKEAWLRRVGLGETTPAPDAAATDALRARVASHTTEPGGSDEVRWRCQATELVRASIPLSTNDPRPYMRELTCGNVSAGTFVRVMARAAAMQPLHRLDLLPMPPVKGETSTSPSFPPLDVQPGDWVRVKPVEEIRKAVNDKGRNRGLWFDREMKVFCGRVMQVRGRVARIIDESNGRMIELTSDCIKLEDGVCSGEHSTGRWFCPREIYSYFRECWLERAEEPSPSVPDRLTG